MSENLYTRKKQPKQKSSYFHLLTSAMIETIKKKINNDTKI